MAQEVTLAMNVSVGQLKKDLSAILNQVAYRGERVIVESRGRPKAVLISVEELERLESGSASRDEAVRRTRSTLDDLDRLRARIGRSDIVEDLGALREGRSRGLAGNP